MRLGISTLITVLLLSASPTLAKQVTCEFNDYGYGNSEEITISWLGSGAVIDTETGKLYQTFPDGGRSKSYQTKVKQGKRFTTYKWTIKAQKGFPKQTYSYRTYTTGKCQGYMESSGFFDLVAKGKW